MLGFNIMASNFGNGDLNITFSKKIDKEKDNLVKEKVSKLANSIYDSLSTEQQKNIDHINFSLDPRDDHLAVLVKTKSDTVQYDTEHLDNQIKELTDIVHQLGLEALAKPDESSKDIMESTEKPSAEEFKTAKDKFNAIKNMAQEAAVELSLIKSELEVLNIEINQQQSELDQLQGSRESDTNKLTKLRETITELKQSQVNLNASKKELENTILENKKAIELEEQSKNNAESFLSSSQSSKDEMNLLFENTSKSNNQNKNLLKEVENSRSQAERSVKNEQEAISNLERSLEKEGNSKKDIEKGIKQEQQAQELINTSLSEKNTTLKDLDESIIKEKKSYENLEKSLNSTQNSLTDLQKQVGQVRAFRPWSSFKNIFINLGYIIPLGIPVLYRYFFSVPKEIKQQAEDITEMEKQVSTLQSDVNLSKDRFNSLSSQKDSEQQTINQLNQDIENSKEGIIQSNQALHQSAEKMNQITREIEDSSENIEKFTKQFQGFNDEFERLTQTIMKSEKELIEIKQKIEDLQNPQEFLQKIEGHKNKMIQLQNSVSLTEEKMKILKKQEVELGLKINNFEQISAKQIEQEALNKDQEIQTKDQYLKQLIQKKEEKEKNLSEFRDVFYDRIDQRKLNLAFNDVVAGVSAEIENEEMFRLIQDNSDHLLREAEEAELEKTKPLSISQPAKPIMDLENKSNAENLSDTNQQNAITIGLYGNVYDLDSDTESDNDLSSASTISQTRSSTPESQSLTPLKTNADLRKTSPENESSTLSDASTNRLSESGSIQETVKLKQPSPFQNLAPPVQPQSGVSGVLSTSKKINIAKSPLEELPDTEASLLAGAKELFGRLAILKDKYRKDRFIQKFYQDVGMGIQQIQIFHDKMKEALDPKKSLEEQYQNLENAYASEEFKIYSEKLMTLTLMYEEFNAMIKRNKNTYFVDVKDAKNQEKKITIIDPVDPNFSNPSIFIQRLPRHILYIDVLNKSKETEKKITDMNVKKGAQNVVNALSRRDFFIKFYLENKKLLSFNDSFKNETLIPWLLNTNKSFSDFATSLERLNDYFPRKDEKKIKDFKEKLIHFALVYNSEKGLGDYQNFLQKKYDKTKLASDKKLLEDATYFHDYRNKVTQKTNEQLLADKLLLEDKLRGLESIGKNNALSTANKALWNEDVKEVSDFLAAINRMINARKSQGINAA